MGIETKWENIKLITMLYIKSPTELGMIPKRKRHLHWIRGDGIYYSVTCSRKYANTYNPFLYCYNIYLRECNAFRTLLAILIQRFMAAS